MEDSSSAYVVSDTSSVWGGVQWVQDFACVSGTPSLAEFDGNQAAFRDELDVLASNRVDVRKIEKDQSDTVSEAADPGKLKDELKCPQWEPAFVNYLSMMMPGVNGVPLSYVMREKEEPNMETAFESFNERAIACFPIEGAVFQADARKVHHLIKSFLQTETADQWIKPPARKQSGRVDMKALRDHYSGEGNSSHRIEFAIHCNTNMKGQWRSSRRFSTSYKRCLTSSKKKTK